MRDFMVNNDYSRVVNPYEGFSKGISRVGSLLESYYDRKDAEEERAYNRQRQAEADARATELYNRQIAEYDRSLAKENKLTADKAILGELATDKHSNLWLGISDAQRANIADQVGSRKSLEAMGIPIKDIPEKQPGGKVGWGVDYSKITPEMGYRIYRMLGGLEQSLLSASTTPRTQENAFEERYRAAIARGVDPELARAEAKEVSSRLPTRAELLEAGQASHKAALEAEQEAFKNTLEYAKLVEDLVDGGYSRTSSSGDKSIRTGGDYVKSLVDEGLIGHDRSTANKIYTFIEDLEKEGYSQQEVVRALSDTDKYKPGYIWGGGTEVDLAAARERLKNQISNTRTNPYRAQADSVLANLQSRLATIEENRTKPLPTYEEIEAKGANAILKDFKDRVSRTGFAPKPTNIKVGNQEEGERRVSQDTESTSGVVRNQEREKVFNALLNRDTDSESRYQRDLTQLGLRNDTPPQEVITTLSDLAAEQGNSLTPGQFSLLQDALKERGGENFGQDAMRTREFFEGGQSRELDNILRSRNPELAKDLIIRRLSSLNQENRDRVLLNASPEVQRLVNEDVPEESREGFFKKLFSFKYGPRLGRPTE